MTSTPSIDYAVPVNFAVPQNGAVNISINDYTDLLLHSKEYTVGSGKSKFTYTIVHTTAGFISLNITKAGTQAVWVADNFTIKEVYANANGNYSFDIERKGKISRLPFEAIVPKNICTAFYAKGIAVCCDDRMNEAFSKYLQGMLSKFEAQDAKQILGWQIKQDDLTWTGSSLLKYHNTLETEAEYISRLNSLIEGSPPLHFVLSGAAASTLLGYLRLTQKLPVETFAISLVGASSTGKTTALKLAASMYSSTDDEEVFSSFYGTENALIYAIGKHYGVPLCYDETTVSNSMNKSDLIYMVSMGNSKKSLDSQRQPRQRDMWLCSTLFSSETDLIDYEKDNTGLLARIIPLENLTYTLDSEHSQKIKTFAASNYGIVGELLADWLLKADADKINKIYNEARSALLKSETLCKCDLTNRMTENHALILATAELLNSLGLQLDIAGIREISINAMNHIAEYTNRGKFFIQQIFGYITSNSHRLKGIEWDSNTNLEPTTVSIECGTFDHILNCIKCTDTKTALKEIAKTGCLIRQSEGRFKTRTTRDNVPYYSYRFDMSKVNEQFDGDFELHYSSTKQHQQWDSYCSMIDDSEAVINGYNCRINGEERTYEGKLFFL